MLFFNIMKIDNIVTRYLMQYELLLNLVAPNHRQKDITNLNTLAHISALAVALAAVLHGSHSYRSAKQLRRSA